MLWLRSWIRQVWVFSHLLTLWPLSFLCLSFFWKWRKGQDLSVEREIPGVSEASSLAPMGFGLWLEQATLPTLWLDPTSSISKPLGFGALGAFPKWDNREAQTANTTNEGQEFVDKCLISEFREIIWCVVTMDPRGCTPGVSLSCSEC